MYLLDSLDRHSALVAAGLWDMRTITLNATRMHRTNCILLGVSEHSLYGARTRGLVGSVTENCLVLSLNDSLPSKKCGQVLYRVSNCIYY